MMLRDTDSSGNCSMHSPAYSLARGQRRNRIHPMVRILVLSCLVGCVVVAGISQSVEIAEKQYQLEELQRELKEVHQLNQHLQLETARLQSLERIEALAREQLGMVEPSQVKTIVLGPIPASDSVRVARDEGGTQTVTKPNRYLQLAARVLGRILPALDQAEAGRLSGK